jgi:hypothetical protein
MNFISTVILILDLSSGNMEGRTASDWPIPAGSYPRLQQSSGNSARTGLAVLIYTGEIAPHCPRIASTVLNLQSHTSLESLPASLGPLSPDIASYRVRYPSSPPRPTSYDSSFGSKALEFLARTENLHFGHPNCALTNNKRYRIRVDPSSHRHPLFNRILLSPAELLPVRR